MKKYTEDELNEVLRLHKKWLRNEAGGVRANLTGADLSGANLRGADLSGADLTRANLTGVNLSGAKMHGAKMTRAILKEVRAVRTFKIFSGLYEYTCMAIVSENGTPWVRMGCHYKPLSEWESLGIRNVNTSEFPHGTPKSERRARAYEFCKAEVLAMVAEMEGDRA